MYLCVRVRVRVCVWGRRPWEKKEKRKRNEKKEKRKNKETGEKRRHKLIHTDKKTDRQTDGRADRHKSFDWYEILYWTI